MERKCFWLFSLILWTLSLTELVIADNKSPEDPKISELPISNLISEKKQKNTENVNDVNGGDMNEKILTMNDGEKEEANWNVYEILDEEVNITQSVSYIKNIPVSNYWDAHRGGFRTGVLGEQILDTYPQFVTYSLIKNGTKESKGPISLINITTIDTSSLFMHLFLVVKHMAEKTLNTSEITKSLENQFNNFEKKLKIWRNLTGEDWKTAAQLRAECSQKEIQIAMLDKRIEMIKLRTNERLAVIKEYYQNKTKLLEEFHEFSLRTKEEMHSRMLTLETDVEKEKLELVKTAEEDRLTTQLQLLNLTHQQTIVKLGQEINSSIAALYFRAEEESRAAHENEDVSRNILVAQAENMRRNFEDIFLLFKTQLTNVIDIALSSPLLVLKWALIFSFFLSLSVLSTEMYAILRLLLLRSFTSPLVIRESRKGTPSLPIPTNHLKTLPKGGDDLEASSKLMTFDQMILSSKAKESLYHLSRVLVMRETVLKGYHSAVNIHNNWRRRNDALCLPNILIIGSPGTGKSLAATSLAYNSGLPFLTLCGGDILGASPTLSSPSAVPTSLHSGGPGGLLRDVLDSAESENNRKGYFVILDEADAIITKAKKLNQTTSSSSSTSTTGTTNGSISTSTSEVIVTHESREEVIVDCLHILLHRLRMNSPSLGTIITTNMDIELIDLALLDRMDHIIQLDLPDAFHRLQGFIHYTSLYLSSYLSSSQSDCLLQIHQATIENLDDESKKKQKLIFPTQSLGAIIESIKEIFEKKISGNEIGSIGGQVPPAPTTTTTSTTTSTTTATAVTGKENGSTNSAKKKSKKNTTTKADDITPPSEGTRDTPLSKDQLKPKDVSMMSSSGDEKEEMDVIVCLGVSLLQSDGWSYREIEKFMKGILSAVLSTERCQLTSQIWLDQIQYKKAHLHLGRGQTNSTNITPPQGSPCTG